MKNLMIILLPLLLVLQTSCKNFLTSYGYKDTSYYSCLLSAGNSMIVLSIAEDNVTNAILPDSIQAVYNARNAGLKVEGIVYPCRNRTIEDNVQIVGTAFPYPVFQRIWVSMPENASACGWQNYQASSNCQYLQTLLPKLSQILHKIPIQIVTTTASWSDIFKSQYGCPQISLSSKLWWKNHLPDQPNFNDYIQIAGWERPYAKVYNISNVCGALVLVNYWEG